MVDNMALKAQSLTATRVGLKVDSTVIKTPVGLFND